MADNVANQFVGLLYFQIASFYVHAHGIKNNSVLVGWQSKGNLRGGSGCRDDDD